MPTHSHLRRARHHAAPAAFLACLALVVSSVAVAAPATGVPARPSAVESKPAAPSASWAVAPVVAASAAPLASAVASATASAGLAPVAPPAGEPGTIQVDTMTARGLLEADARGGVARRMDRLQACLADPKNNQHGVLSLKVGVDASGSVSHSKAVGGDLGGTPLGSCLLAVFYKMGFAATTANSANFQITLRVP